MSANQESLNQTLLFAEPKIRNGALFAIDSEINSSIIARYHQWASEGRIDFDSVRFIQAIIELCENDIDKTTDVYELGELYGKSRSTILIRCKYLVGLGLINKDRIKVPGKRRVTRYRIQNIDKVIPPPLPDNVPIPDDQNNNVADLCSVKDQLSYSFTSKRQFGVKGESFSIFTLAAALPSGKTGKFFERSYTCPIRIGKDLVELEVRPTEGSKPASVLDLRILTAVTTIIYRQVEQGKEALNPFVIEFDELYSLMSPGNRKKSGSYKNYLLSALKRWESTGFSVTKASEGFLEKYKGKIELNEDFRLIYKIKTLSFVGTKGKIPQKIAVFIDEEFLSRITDPSVRFLLALDEDVLFESNPFALRFNIWCRRAVQHNHKPRSWRIDWLHSEIEPLRLKKKFTADLKELFNLKFDSRLGYAKHLGYNFQREENGNYLIWADPSDRLVGQHSHYQHIKKTQCQN